MTPAERLQVRLFLALFSGATGPLCTLLSCGTEYWLLAAQTCGDVPHRQVGSIFHEGIFWRCSFPAGSPQFSMWDLWILNQRHPKLCQAAFLFPFPVGEAAVSSSWAEPRPSPTSASESASAIVFRTFWSIFLVVGVATAVTGLLVVGCAALLTSPRLYKVGGALQVCAGLSLLAVLVLFLVWTQVLDTLEKFALHQRASSCASFQLALQHGPSFLLLPVAVFFLLLAGLLAVLIGGSVHRMQEEPGDKLPDATEL